MGVRVLPLIKLASALAHLKNKLRFVVQKAQKLLAAPTGGCKNCAKRAVGLKKATRQRMLGSTLYLIPDLVDSGGSYQNKNNKS